MTQLETRARLKQKMLGVRIRTARTQCGLEIAQVAEKIGISAQLLESYEEGQAETNLPELEALAQICFVPVTYFWANGQTNESDLAKRVSIRRKMLGVQLAQARQDAGLSLAEVAQAIDVTEADVTSYEYGTQAVPFGKLEAIATYLKHPLSHFLETAKPVSSIPEKTSARDPFGTRNLTPPDSDSARQTRQSPAANQAPDLAWLTHLPDDAKEFLTDPTNLLYLKLSMRLHSLSADTLRRLAEGILDITY